MDKGYEQTIHRKEVQIANKHMNQGNANSSKKFFLAIDWINLKKHKLKCNTRFLPIKVAKTPIIDEGEEDRYFHTQLVGM